MSATSLLPGMQLLWLLPSAEQIHPCVAKMICAGRPLLLQPFVSLDSMLQPYCTGVATLGRGGLQQTPTPFITLRSSTSELQNTSPSALTSLSTRQIACGRFEAQRCFATAGTIISAAAYEPADVGRQESSVRRTRSKAQAQRHLSQRLPDCTAVMGWRVRDTTAGDQDIGVVREVRRPSVYW